MSCVETTLTENLFFIDTKYVDIVTYLENKTFKEVGLDFMPTIPRFI